VLLTQFYR